MKKPKGLIRFASENEIKNGIPFKVNSRIIAYSVVLLILLSVFVGLFITNKQTETTILRTSGSLYQVQENGDILNIYNMKVINKTNNNLPLEVKLIDPKGSLKRISPSDTLRREDSMEDVLLLSIPKDELQSGSNKITFGIFVNGEMVEEVKTAFLAP